MDVNYNVCRGGAIPPKKSGHNIIFHIPNKTWETPVIELLPGSSLRIESGIKMNIPDGFGMMLNNYPLNSSNYGLQVNTQIIHNTYESEIIINLHSSNKNNSIFIHEGDIIAIGIIISLPEYNFNNSEDKNNG